MKDRFCSAEDAVLLHSVSEEFGLPCGSLKIEKGIIKPFEPIISDGVNFLSFQKLAFDGNTRYQWSQLKKSVGFLVNPHTPFSDTGDGIMLAAMVAYQAGTNLYDKFGGDFKILLPLEVGFTPMRTITKSFNLNGANFTFNSWDPDLKSRQFNLILKGPAINAKERTFSLSLGGEERQWSI